ncbi:MAG: sulfurtransferase complex subunit TusB [Pseudomonadales bacterium]|nr:sulfurtransferase complex subunit TusB [Pseudomonadales bacterium]
MSTLYTVNRSPATGLLERCQRFAKPGDGILFLEDGTYHGAQESTLSELDSDIAVYCLKEDLAARGLTEKITDRAQPVSYRRFVELCTEFDKVVSWF